MYRYIVDNAVTYTPDDLVLFRESPFAVWMERLTLENPDHGIPPDLESLSVPRKAERPDDIVATLRAEGRNVALIDPLQDEPARRESTLKAMRGGADFIVNGQLAIGNLSGSVKLLMRTSGFSELGDFLYMPCETHVENTLSSAFRLCFAADLLAKLQGQVPPQMLIIRDGAEVVPLQTEDYIYYYRAVYNRFVQAMLGFRKHRMPDPAESSHFGRWADCASEVLKQKAAEDRAEEQLPEEQQVVQAKEGLVEVPQLRVASAAGLWTQYDTDEPVRTDFTAVNTGSSNIAQSAMPNRSDSSQTLAEQAQQLKPGSFRNVTPPGHTPSLARIGRPRFVPEITSEEAATPDAQGVSGTLDNLEFIGGGRTDKRDAEPAVADIEFVEVNRPAPAPNLRGTAIREKSPADRDPVSATPYLRDLEPKAPVFLPPDTTDVPALPRELPKTRQRHAADFERGPDSVVDLDSAPAPNLAPVVQRAEAVFERLFPDDPTFRKAESGKSKSEWDDVDAPVTPFSNSLKTSEEFNDG